jgi:hypothetical protein
MEKPERARGVATLRARAPTREFSMPTIREYSTPADTCEVLPNNSACATGDLERFDKAHEVVSEQHDICTLLSDIGARPHGDADVRFGERRCVVDTVPHHRHRSLLLHEGLDPGELILRQEFCLDLPDAERMADGRGNRQGVAGEQSIARLASGRTVSATATAPRSFPSRATRTSDAASTPWPSKAGTAIRLSCIHALLPTRTVAPPIRASMPRPGVYANRSGSVTVRPWACAWATIARPSGCSERNSAAAAASSRSSACTPASGKIDCTAGRPKVRVPVLSRTTVSTLPKVSRCTPPLTMAPSRAERPMPPRMASGVPAAMPHAPATITTEIVE